MRRNARAFALAALALFAAACSRQTASAPVPPPVAPPLLLRANLFGEPLRSDAQISPRGDLIAFLAPRPLETGPLNLWVVPTAALGAARPISSGLSVRGYQWAADGHTILALTDNDGDGDKSLSAIDALTGDARVLTDEANTEIVGVSGADPGAVIVAWNARARAWPDLYRIDFATGSRTLIERNTRSFFRYVLDRENRLRLGLKMNATGALEIWKRSAEGEWSKLSEAPFEDALLSAPIAFESGGQSFLMFDSTGHDRAVLVRVDAETGARTVLGESDRADVVDAWRDPGTGQPEAFAVEYLRREWRALDAEAQADLTYLDAQLEGEPRVVSRTLDDKAWIVVEEGPTIPARTYLYNRSDLASRSLRLLFHNRPALEGAPLQQMIPVEIEARDGLTLVSYLTLPIASDANGDSRPDSPAPLVVIVHDGPWSRARFGFDPLHQWLANRGYAVLSVNYRGSTGFGRAFLNAGNREWGGKMQEDLLDAVQWAVEERIAQPEHIAIFGEGYGGYAALNGLAFTPERFACGVDVAGPGNLETFINNTPPSEEWARPSYYLRVGDPRTPGGRDFLAQRSPLSRAASIARPLLIAQGARDPHVMRADSDMISIAPRARRAGLVYMLYPDIAALDLRAANWISFTSVADHFLAHCLGGRAEPIGQAFSGVRAQALIGAAHVDGLANVAPAPLVPTAPATAVTPAAELPLAAPPMLEDAPKTP